MRVDCWVEQNISEPFLRHELILLKRKLQFDKIQRETPSLFVNYQRENREEGPQKMPPFKTSA